MDIQKTMRAVNEFQNSLDKIRPFMTMVQTASEIWNELASINPDVLQSSIDQKNNLDAQIASLTANRDTLQGQINGLNSEYAAKKGALDSDYLALKSQTEAAHAANLERMRNEVAAIQAEKDRIMNEQQNAVAQLSNQRDQLDSQVRLLRQAFQQSHQAING